MQKIAATIKPMDIKVKQVGKNSSNKNSSLVIFSINLFILSLLNKSIQHSWRIYCIIVLLILQYGHFQLIHTFYSIVEFCRKLFT